MGLINLILKTTLRRPTRDSDGYDDFVQVKMRAGYPS